MARAPQNLENHARLLPEFHVVVYLLLLIDFFFALSEAVRGAGAASIVHLATAVALLIMATSLRRQVLTVQDRVIRLEMRLRLREVLPPDLQGQIPSLSVGQLVALRFASDAELPGLVRDVIGGRLTDSKAIKAQVRDWQADYLRA
jgi:hypothetical protein